MTWSNLHFNRIIQATVLRVNSRGKQGNSGTIRKISEHRPTNKTHLPWWVSLKASIMELGKSSSLTLNISLQECLQSSQTGNQGKSLFSQGGQAPESSLGWKMWNDSHSVGYSRLGAGLEWGKKKKLYLNQEPSHKLKLVKSSQLLTDFMFWNSNAWRLSQLKPCLRNEPVMDGSAVLLLKEMDVFWA